MSVKIDNSKINFEILKTKEYYPINLDDEISKANILLIPFENFRNGFVALFPEVTDDFFQFLKSHESSEFVPNIVIDDDKYEKIEMHCDWLNLGSVLVQSVVFPLFISLLANYISGRIEKNKLNKESTVEIEINVEETKSKKTKRINYKGSAKDIEKSLSNITEKIFKDEH